MSNIIKREEDQFALGFPDANEWGAISQMAAACVVSGIFSNAKTKEVAIGIMLKGRYLRVDPVWALERIHPIETSGRFNLSIDGQGMLALIRRDGTINYHVRDEQDAAVCEMIREGDEKPTVIRFGEEDAQRAGLTGKFNYKAYPKEMYRWRAIVTCARLVCPDLLGGMYLADEMGAVVDEEGIPVGMEGKTPVHEAEVKFSKAKVGESDAIVAEVVTPPTPPAPEPKPTPPPEKKEAPKPEAPPPPAPKNGNGLTPERRKQMSQNLHIVWRQKIAGLGVAVGKKFAEEESAQLLFDLCQDRGIKAILDKDGVHFSHLEPEDFNVMHAVMKEPGLLDVLKALLAKSPPVEEPVEEPEPPKEKEKEVPLGELFPTETTEAPKKEKKSIQDAVKELQDAIEEEAGPKGMRLHLSILKANGLTGTGERTDEMYEKAKKSLAEAYKGLVTGESIEDLVVKFG